MLLQDYLEAKEEFDRLPQQLKSNIRKHGHVHQYHTIIIDCSPMLFVDAAGVDVLLKVGGWEEALAPAQAFPLYCTIDCFPSLTSTHCVRCTDRPWLLVTQTCVNTDQGSSIDHNTRCSSGQD